MFLVNESFYAFTTFRFNFKLILNELKRLRIIHPFFTFNERIVTVWTEPLMRVDLFLCLLELFFLCQFVMLLFFLHAHFKGSKGKMTYIYLSFLGILQRHGLIRKIEII